MNLVAFDLDGTLEDSRPDMVAAIHRTRALLGLPPRPTGQVRPWVWRGMPALYANAFDDHAGPLEAVRAAYEADYLAHVHVDTQLYPGVPEALARIGQRATLAVVTNKPEHIACALLAALGLDRRFATVVGGDSCAHAKPHPVMLAEAARRTGFDPGRGRLVMVGDSAGDLKLAQAARAAGIWCAYGYHPRPEPAPALEAATPMDLPGLIDALLAGG